MAEQSIERPNVCVKNSPGAGTLLHPTGSQFEASRFDLFYLFFCIVLLLFGWFGLKFVANLLVCLKHFSRVH